MNDWLHDLPVIWMAPLIVFGFTYLVAAAIYALVMVLAVGERVRSLKAVSAGASHAGSRVSGNSQNNEFVVMPA